MPIDREFVRGVEVIRIRREYPMPEIYMSVSGGPFPNEVEMYPCWWDAESQRWGKAVGMRAANPPPVDEVVLWKNLHTFVVQRWEKVKEENAALKLEADNLRNTRDWFDAATKAAVEKEREACAKLVAGEDSTSVEVLAARIRERSLPTGGGGKGIRIGGEGQGPPEGTLGRTDDPNLSCWLGSDKFNSSYPVDWTNRNGATKPTEP